MWLKSYLGCSVTVNIKGIVIGEKVVADHDAVLADANARTRDQFSYFNVRLSAKRAMERSAHRIGRTGHAD